MATNTHKTEKEDLIKELKVLRAQIAVLKEDKEVHKKLEQENDLLKTLILAISHAGDLHSALGIAIRKVCEATGWVLGQAFIPSGDETHLVCSPAWFTNVSGLEKFRTLSEGFKFLPGIGLPGRVWSSKRPSWAIDVTKDSNFPRAPIALEVGLKAGFATPIIAGEKVIAVIEFFMLETKKEEDAQLVSLVSAVANQLGTLFERKQAEKKLKDSEGIYQSLVESLPQNVMRKDLNGRFTFVNKYFCKILGKTEKEIIGKTDFDFYPRELATKYRNDDKIVIKTGKVLEYIEENELPAGSRIFVKVIKSPIYNSNKEIIGVQIIFWDITESKLAFEENKKTQELLNESLEKQIEERTKELKQSEEKYKKLIETANDAIFSWTLEGKNISWNSSAERIYGYKASEIKNKHLSILIPPEHHDEAEKIFEQIKEGKRIVNYETVRLKKDGTPVNVSLTISPITDATGKIVELSTIARDITEHKKLLLALEKANKEEEQRKELQAIDKLASSPQTDTITQLYGFTSLSKSFPDVFKEMVNRYKRLLDLAVEEIETNKDNNVSEELLFMGKQLGFLRASPKDVLEIHSTTIKRRNGNHSSPKTQAYTEVGRRTSLELMGYLAIYYRNFTMSTKKINIIDDQTEKVHK